MRRLLTMGLALALAGCGGGEEVANNSAAPTPTPTPGPMLGGVDLDKPIRATGSAPYWAIYIAPGTIAFADAPAAHPRISTRYRPNSRAIPCASRRRRPKPSR
ncbi:hypothetical protein PIB19_00355 [Sphingomonas sp. 7/4-4]|uniref:hypothetical protein n=1 Tax=Sphingomonas sp. 7/4-4 TaxID=3018446 RepID=UPI0022F37E9D|nr:hypothetical protein [Sphingomonas sp. 7/4-4]WBY08056.1 hypothetical protein PIB19_00355 [Sphingomonas sp. 7/4-4]